MDQNILKKEENFHRLNAELEMKTRELWKEMEHVLKLQEAASNSPPAPSPNVSLDHSSTIAEPPTTILPSAVPKEVKRNEGLMGPKLLAHRGAVRLPLTGPRVISGRLGKTRNADMLLAAKYGTNIHPNSRQESVSGDGDDVIPPEGREMGDQATIRFLKAKTKVLQDEYSSLQSETRRTHMELQKTKSLLKEMEDEKIKWQMQATNAKETMLKQEQWSAMVSKKMTDKDAEISSLRKEMEKLKRELKIAVQHQGGNDIRLNRAVEEVEKLKGALRTMKQEEKEKRDENKKKCEELVSTIRKLEKQKQELIAAFKKELQLIDNLKKQKAHLEACRVVQFTEEEFLRLLEWKPRTDEEDGPPQIGGHT